MTAFGTPEGARVLQRPMSLKVTECDYEKMASAKRPSMLAEADCLKLTAT
jgi:hypothetical protein